MVWKRQHFIHPSVERENFFTRPKVISDKRVVHAHTYRRNSAIPKSVLDKRVAVYNGRKFISFMVRKWMLGHKFGEFCLTKRLGSKIHEKIIKKKKSRSK